MVRSQTTCHPDQNNMIKAQEVQMALMIQTVQKAQKVQMASMIQKIQNVQKIEMMVVGMQKAAK